jgi:hypothetical protein
VTDETHEHDALRARLRAADPAASLPSADPTRVARLLEDTMSHDTAVRSTESREDGTRNRSPLTWLVAAAAVLLIAGVATFGWLNRDQARNEVAVPGDRPTVTQLRAPEAAAYRARCMVPSAATLSHQTTAFAGTVSSLAAGTVVLEPTRWYAGEPTDRVEVEAPSADLQALIGAVRFEQGGRYLVSATGGELTVCGLTAPYSARLAGLYDRAFGG